MQGTMLWFNLDKGYGFIRTEDDERLYVAQNDFLPDHEPAARCKGREVNFERLVAEGDTRAINVSFVEQADPRRARRRHGQGRTTL